MDNINKIKDTKSKDNKTSSKVLDVISYKKELDKKMKYKKGDTIVYHNVKYNIHERYALGDKGNFYELVPTTPTVPIKQNEIQKHIYAVDQVYIIQDELNCRLGEEIDINEPAHNSYDIYSEVLLGGKDKDEYEKNLKFIDSLNINNKEYSLGFSFDTGGYEYWEEHDFENDIKVVLDIHNHQFDMDTLTKDIRKTIDELEKINYPYESHRYKVENGLYFNEREIKIGTVDSIDKKTKYIIEKRKESKLSDEEFSKSNNIKDTAYEILDTLESENIKTTYNNLTNLNYHILVKILNYNGYFNKSLSTSIREELKTFSLI